MPIYEIQHAIPLTISQQDELASKITHIHSQKFTTPKLFVNVYYTDVSERRHYIGGHRRLGNHIFGHVRTGPTRTQEDWNELTQAFSQAWDEVCGTPVPTRKGGKEQGDTTLKSVILVGGMAAGLEQGFVLPQAGQDVAWLRENWGEFNRKAEEGDEDMAEMVKEVEERGLMGREVNGDKARADRMNEMLGWGDAA